LSYYLDMSDSGLPGPAPSRQPVPSPAATSLRVGDVVEVRSVDEILATLDERGELEALPFMPEMLQFCGRRFVVHRRAIKVCDTANWRGMHRMERTVHLAALPEANGGSGVPEPAPSPSPASATVPMIPAIPQGLRCDGRSHGGCQASCLLFWKEAWLRRVETPGAASTAEAAAPSQPASPATIATLEAATRATANGSATNGDAAASEGGPGDAPAEVRYACQATAMPRAASVRMPWWDMSQYVRDVRSGNARAAPMLRSVGLLLFNKFQAANRRFLPRARLIHGAENYPFVTGQLSRTPKEQVGLQPGDLVEVRSKEEILATLDRQGRNRGLRFDAEMLRYCGKRARVLRRVEHIVEEHTGRMLRLPGDCIILDGAICIGDYNQYCPRAIYPYWREIWLRRVTE
jgi:hypothetical protein